MPRAERRQVDQTAVDVQEQQVDLLGLDVGGATLKAADETGRAAARRFPLWRTPAALTEALSELCRPWLPRAIAAVMTGELCDCFETRALGVAHIVSAIEQAFPHSEILIFG